MSIKPGFDEKLIGMIESLMPVKSDQIEMLIDIMCLGKEAAYRRLRGDVPFSFEEACQIATRLGFSLDNVAQAAWRNDPITMELVTEPPETTEDFSTYYFSQLCADHEVFIKYVEDPNFTVLGAYNVLPHALVFPFPNLFRFCAFQWAYQMGRKNTSRKLEEIFMSPEIEKKYRMLNQMVIQRHEQSSIFDRRIFITFADHIKYFCNLNLISPEEELILKEELIGLISNVESLASVGQGETEKDILLYVANVDFDANYTYVKGSNFELVYLDIYHITALRSLDSRICRLHKRWIESLRKYSTLVSISGERERIAFFDQQYKYIEELF